MIYGKETREHTKKFKAVKLPQGAPIPREWELMGLARVRPEVNPQRDRHSGSEGSTGSGKATGGYRIAPRHRKIVRQYYDKKETGNQ